MSDLSPAQIKDRVEALLSSSEFGAIFDKHRGMALADDNLLDYRIYLPALAVGSAFDIGCSARPDCCSRGVPPCTSYHLGYAPAS